jgi:signal recognition particle GTPase
MTEEDEAFNEIERRSIAKKEAVKSSVDAKEALTKLLTDSYDQGVKDALESVIQAIKELRPAIMPLEGMGRGKTTQEWFDILVQDIEEKI